MNANFNHSAADMLRQCANTAQAHKLGRTRDWVVVYFHDDDHREGQSTVVTETHGAMTGRRVVRGRERECAAALPRKVS